MLTQRNVDAIEGWMEHGVPADRGTRDWICDELLRDLWEDREQWRRNAFELLKAQETNP